MRHFTLASLLATALTLGLMTATPSMAQGTQPATKSDSKMAPAPKASALLQALMPAIASVLSPGMPVAGGYWLPLPAMTASAAALAMAGGPSTSGKPWPRLTAPVTAARADITPKTELPRPARLRLSRGRFT